jgi:predicted transcriptional regulator
MNTAQTSWNFRHIEFLIDIAEDCKTIKTLSATKLKRFLELKEAGLVQESEDHCGKYAELTPKGKGLLDQLEDSFVDYLISV